MSLSEASNVDAPPAVSNGHPADPIRHGTVPTVTTGDERTTGSFLFTDVEGSTRRWEQFPVAMVEALQRHDALLSEIAERLGGRTIHRSGDGMIAAFDEPADAMAAAVTAQRAIRDADWSAVDGLAVRMGVHTGDVLVHDGEMFGWALNFGSRFTAIGHGGQILVSEAAADAAAGSLPASFDLQLLGTRRLRDIARPTQVFQLVAPGLDAGFPRLRDSVPAVTTVARPTRLVGREAEVTSVLAHVGPGRVVSVVGPPGVGASQMAREVAHCTADRFAFGLRYCDISGVPVGQVPDALATALSVTVRAGESVVDIVVERIAQHPMLLLLDGVDRVDPGVSELVRTVVNRAPESAVLCAGQLSLRVDGEIVHRVGPLAGPAAVELFEHCAADHGVGLDDPAGAARLCDLVDNVPLAIEVLAAGLVRYDVASLIAMFEQRRLPDSVRSDPALRATLDAVNVGIDGLSDDATDMLAGATVFPGPFERAWFGPVCGSTGSGADADAVLDMLVERSLVHVDRVDGIPRFRVLATVADAVSARSEHAGRRRAERRFVDHVLAFCRDAATGLRGPEETLWVRRLDRNFDAIRVAFERCLMAGDLDRSAGIATVLWDYGFMRLRDEYFRWTDRVIDRFDTPDGSPPPELGAVFGVAALGAWIRGDLDRAGSMAARAIAMETEHDLDFDLPARLALMSSMVYSGTTDVDLELFGELAAHQRRQPDLYFHVNVDTQNSIMATWLGDSEGGERRAIRALGTARTSGNPSSIAFALWAAGAAIIPTDPLRAESLLAEALETARGCENGWVTSLVQLTLASQRRRTTGAIHATPILIELIAMLDRAGNRSQLWATLRLTALVLGDLDVDELAVQVDSVVSAAGMAMPPLPADARDLELQRRRLAERHPEPWRRRAAALASTWDLATTVARVDAALRSALEGTYPAPTA